MCNHEESTQPAAASGRERNAWTLIDDFDKPMQHLYNLDAMIACTRMAIEHLQDNYSGGEDLCQISHLLSMSKMELAEACAELEEVLSEIKLNH